MGKLNGRRVRTRLLLSACLAGVSGSAAAQTTVSGAQTTNQNLSGAQALTVTSTGSIVVSGSQAVNINATSTGAGVAINNAGRIEGVASTNSNGRGISSSGDYADRTATIINTGSIVGGNDAIRFAPTTVTTAATGTIGIDNSGAITGNSGNGTAQASGSQGIEDTVLGTGLMVTNRAGATISGSQAILSAAATTTIDNFGTILGTAAVGTQGEAIRTNLVTGAPTGVGTALSVVNEAGATINGVYGIIGTGPSNTIVNRGTITGNATATIGTTGTITREAIRLNAGVTANQVNVVTLAAGSTTTAGTGTGATGNAVVFGGTVAAGYTMTNTLNVEVGATVSGALAGSGQAAATDTLNLTGTGAQVLGTASGFEGLNVQGGTWGITSAFTPTSGATIASGATLRYDDAGATGGSVAGTIADSGTLIDNRTATVTHSGAVSGAGSVQVVNTGTLVFGSVNSYSGDTTISNGRLRTGQLADSFSPNSAVTVTGQGILDLNDTTLDGLGNGVPVARDQAIANIAGNGTVRLGQLNAATLTTGGGGGDTTFAGTFTQLGNVTKVGTGTLTLSGANTATGTLAVSGGGVALPGSWAGAVTLADGTALGGAGTIAGTLTVGAASVAPGNGGIGTLTAGGLSLSAGSILNYQLGAPGTAGDLIQVNGNLTLDGTVNVANVGGFGIGVYRLMNYTGALTDNGLAIGATPSGTTPALFSVQTTVTSQVNLIYGAPAPTTLQFWDGADLVGNGTIDGGTGSWTNNLPNWADANGNNNTAWTGNFAVFQGAAGVVSVDAPISFTGAQFLTDGYVVAAGTGSLSATATLTSLRVDPGVTATISAAIGGSGGLFKQDAGTLVLGGANSYAGSTTVSGGTLRVTGGAAIPTTSTVGVSAGATLDVAASQAIGDLTGNGAVTLSGGTLTTGAIGGTVSFDGTISGAGGLTKAGTGTLTLTGANSYAGATTVNAGTLTLGGTGTIGGGDLAVAAGAALALNGHAASVGALSGAGAVQLGANGALATTTAASTSFTGTLTGNGATLTKAGAGTLTLGGASTLGAIAINGGGIVASAAGSLGAGAAVTVGGTLQLGADQTIASIGGSGAVTLAGGSLTVAGSGTTTLAGPITGSGGLTRAGTGTLVLTGVETFTGGTAVTGGTLQIDGSLAGGATVSGGGTLAGRGSIAGTVTVTDGRIAPGGTSVGTLTTGGLILGAASNLDYQFGAPTAVGDRLQVNGALTLDGTVNVADLGGFGPGVYRLIDYSGALTDNGLAVGTLPGGVTRNQVQVQTAVAQQVNLVVGASLPAIQFWDGPNTTSNGVVDGGSGSWTNARTAWTDANGTNNAAWGGQFAVFSGAAGTVTVNDAIDVTGMQFTTGGYVIAAGSGALSATQAATNIRTDPGVVATINAAIGGAGGINKLDAGTLVLGGVNGYAGATTVAGGTLRAGVAGALPAGTALTVAQGATLDVVAAQTVASLAGAGAVTLSGGGLTTGGGNTDSRFDGTISGAGSLTKVGTATLTLGGANSFTGGATVSAGTLQLAAGGGFGAGTLTVAGGAAADLAGNAASVGGLAGTGSITLGTATLTVAGGGSFGGVVSGAGGFAKSGAGTLTLTGANTYSGTTAVHGGVLAIGTGVLPVAAAVGVDAGATLALGGPVQLGSLTGAGAVTLGANTLTLAAGNVSGAIAGSGGVTKTGTATLTLAGADSYTGATTVNGGTLALAGSNAIAASSAVALAAGTRLDVSGGGAQAVRNLTGAAGSSIVLGANQLTAANDAAVTIASTIGGTGTFIKAGAGTLTLAAVNAQTGGTSVTAGVLQAGVANAFGPGLLTVAAPGSATLANFAQTVSGLAGDGALSLGSATLTVNGNAATSYAGAIDGTGGLTRSGTGTLTLNGASSYSGATNVTGGALLVNGSLASSVTVTSGGRLGGSGTVAAMTVNGTLAPGTGIGTLHAGTATFGAASTFEVEVSPGGAADQLAATGAVAIQGGTVKVLTGGATPFSPFTNYTIVSGASVTGTFGTVTSDAAFLNPSLFYSPSTVQLRLVRNDVSFAAIGASSNQRTVGAAVQAQNGGAVYNSIVVLSAADAQGAFDQLSGEIHAATAETARSEGHAADRAILDRLDTAVGNGPQLWVEGLAAHTTIDGRDGLAGIGSTRTGVEGGAEIAGGGTRGGIGFRHAHDTVDLKARTSSGGVTLNSAFAYLGQQLGALRVGVAGSYGWLDVSTDRQVAYPGFGNRLDGHERGRSYTVVGEVALLPSTGGFRAGPYAGVGYVHTVLDGANETGGAAGLTVGRIADSTGLASYGIRGFGTIGGLRLVADLGGHTYLDDPDRPRPLAFEGFGTTYEARPAGLARTTVAGRLDASYAFGALTLGVGVRGEGGRSTSSYAGQVSAGLRF